MGHMEDLKSLKADLELKIKEAEKELRAEADKRRAATQRVWQFTFAPVLEQDHFDPLWDDSCQYWKLTGTVLNKEECLAAGHGPDHVKGGQMNYLVNRLNGKIIQRSGGGMQFLNGDSSFERNKADQLRDVLNKLEQFIYANPDGGIVTDIVINQKDWPWSRTTGGW